MVAFNTWDSISRTKKVNDPAGVVQYRAVVQGTNAGEIKNPAAANAGKIRGITEANASDGQLVAVRRGGSYLATAASPIAVGDYVNIADTAGRLKTAGEAAATREIVGEAETAAGALGDVFEVNLKQMGSIR